MTPNSKSLKDKKEYWNPHRWKKGWICNSWGSNASPLDDNWKFDDNENYCSLKFLALEVGRFFGIFNQDKCIRRQRWRRCAQAFYFNISILQVEINNFSQKTYVCSSSWTKKETIRWNVKNQKNGGNYLFQPCFYLTVLSTTSYMSSPPEAAQPSCKIPKTPRWPQGLTHIVSC